ncbi:unnamed protein product [Paramecium sonneborni]|uniref:Spt4/RpoE2 zinc finger domain-containing protein n=1 Tax=Paramecium sonneborni TaxID=65129 RepID=A0A8S1K278_9CILI|nr:unnamed protein product [Paramecium sonneborni]
MQSESEISEYDEKKFVIPKSTKDLKACQQCGMVMTIEQWNREVECPNSCNASQTKLFSGLICVLKPSQSWVMRKLGNPKSIHPGLYAIDVQAD